jgi:hypothetical protein
MRMTRSAGAVVAVAAIAAGLLQPAAARAGQGTGARPLSQASAVSDWSQQRYDAAQTGYNPNETELGTGNVGKLVLRASAKLNRPFSAAAPIVADGLVLVTGYYSNGGQPGQIEAFPQTCGAAHSTSCRPVWIADVSTDDSMGLTVANGDVFVNTLTGKPQQKLWVFSLHCGTGGAECKPLWTTTLPGTSYANMAPTVAAGTVYVPWGNVGDAYLYAFPASCQTGCKPTWRGPLADGADGSPSVGDGFVYVADYDSYIYAFRTGCTTGGATCPPTWQASVGEGGPRAVAVADRLVFAGSQDGDLYAFRASGCGSRRQNCPPVWTAVIRAGANILASPAVAYGLVFVTDYVTGYLYAFPENCTKKCQPTWKAYLSPKETADPAVANGVVYVTEGTQVNKTGIEAFSVHCATGGGTCTPIWTGSTGSYYIPSDPAVAGGEVWTADGPQNGPAELYAFGLPAAGHAASRP